MAERFIVAMLDPESGIQSVTIQAPGVHSIDDVVVRFHSKPTAYYQVKHTRVQDSLSFADLISPSRGPSLLRQLAEGWAGIFRMRGPCEAHLLTNRAMSSRARLADVDQEQVQPALSDFWAWLQDAVKAVSNPDDICVPAGWAVAWKQWQAQLETLVPSEVLAFLQSLRIEANEPDLKTLRNDIVARLASLFGIPTSAAELALAQLDHKLREWATSERGQDYEITPERALNAFSLEDAEAVGDHFFPPPAPFFPTRVQFVECLAIRLHDSTIGTFFLTGPAGCGKSSIVTALANRTDPVVDLRFHAFRPITPGSTSIPKDAGRTVTAAALWGDLLIQLRPYFRGRLLENKVPVRNDFLLNEPMRLREHVMRLAGVLAEERGRPVVIAIDGIDHATRAGILAPQALAGRPSLLDSLLPPDKVPQGIVFLIAGQPGSVGYPAWLRTKRPEVHVIEVPPIDIEDIATLLRNDPGAMPVDQIDASARIIAELTGGDALPAVYAVAEAQAQTDGLALKALLEKRRLGTSLEQYYDAIWSAALRDVCDSWPSVDQHLAAALALSSAPLTDNLLACFFPGGLCSADWGAVLSKLAPIVKETAGAYAIRHNDLRVFLMARLGSSTQGLRTAASAMADYYLSATPSDARHEDLLRLLSLADRTGEIPSTFGPEYVAAAVGLQRPMNEILEQGQLALASVQPATGWGGIHTMALGLATLQQARTVAHYYGLEERPRPIPPCLVSETRVMPREDWSLPTIEILLADAQTLLDGGEGARARALFDRWVGDITPVELVAMLEAQPGEIGPSEQPYVRDRLIEAVRTWGKLAQSVGINDRTLSTTVTQEIRPIMLTFYGGWLRAGLATTRPWIESLRLPTVRAVVDVENCVRELAARERWADVAASLEELARNRDQTSPEFQVLAAEWTIRAQLPEALMETWVLPIAEAGFTAVDSSTKRSDRDILDQYVSIAIVIGYARWINHSGSVSDEGTTAYSRGNHDPRTDDHVRRLLYGAAWTGKFLHGVHARRGGEALLMQPDELASVLKSLLSPSWERPASMPPSFLVHATRLIALILHSLSDADAHLEPAVTKVLLAHAAERRAGPTLEPVWRALAQRGYRDELLAWMLEWIGDEGRVWGLDLSERFDIAGRFARLGKESGWASETALLERRLRCSRIGYSGHKDYSLDIPLQWFEGTAYDDPGIWESQGIRLLSISEEASRTGDNRLSIFLESAVATAAAKCGPGSLWRLTSGAAAVSDDGFVLGDISVYDGIIGALKTANLSLEELSSIWAIGLGGLIWALKRDRMELLHLREALLGAASRGGLVDFASRLRSIAPFEYALHESSSGLIHPPRWFAIDEEENHKEPDALDDEVRTRPIAEAVQILVEQAQSGEWERTSKVWRAAAVLVRRRSEEHVLGYDEHVHTIFECLKLRTLGYAWSFDSFAHPVKAIFPLLTEEAQWELCNWTISQLRTKESPDTWLYAASENLRTLVRLHAAASSEERSAGLERELRTQEVWILGFPHDGFRVWPHIRVASPVGDEPACWDDFAFQALLELMGSRGAMRCQTALKGFYALLANSNWVNELGGRSWPALDRKRRQLLLMLLERLAAERPEHFSAWKSIVEAELYNGSGAEQIQAWITLQAYARATGEQEDRWVMPLGKEIAPRGVLRPVKRLLDCPRDTAGTVCLNYGRSSVRTIARMFACAMKTEEELVETIVVSYLDGLPAAEQRCDAPEFRERIPDGDMKMMRGEGVEETIDLLVRETRGGSFGPFSASALAQALLTNDEPRLLTISGCMAEDVDMWPIDAALEKLVAEGENAIVESLHRIAMGGLSSSERLIAAEVITYSRKHDVVLHISAGWAEDPLALNASQAPGTFNGRGHLLYALPGYEPDQAKGQGWFTFRAGGLGMFIHGCLSIMPARLWRSFGWVPTPTDPLSWMVDGKIIARCELIRGPIRDIIQDRLDRQPILLRWVADDGAFDAAARKIGMPVREHVEVEVKPIRLE